MADPPDPVAQSPSEVGGRYVLEGWLGNGARKSVYLGRDRKLKSKVAVALSRVDDIEGGSEAVTEWEATVMGELRDLPHVVSVFDTGVQDGLNYIVLQYMAGGTLSDLFVRAEQDHRPLSIARIATLGSEIAQALAEVHDHGIIHGDVQPKNVWFDAPEGTVHLGDFDLAIRAGAAPHSLRHARTNRSCTAPEVLAGNDPSTQSDLYSLGATLYEEATGHPLFSGSEHEVERQHMEVEPTNPSQFRSDLPRPVCDLILRLLAKDPAKRPPGAAKVAQALAAVARAEQATADLSSLITTGEGPHIEFKETFRAPAGPPPPAVTSDHIADWTAKQIDKVELASLTAIAGFMNTDGGWLLIGVRDDSSVAGIEPDYEHMKRRRADQSERDAWELCFRDVVKARLGEGAPLNISVNLNEHNAKTVALVRCERASAATFIDGQDFVVRDGNRTQKLMPERAMDYARHHWPA